MEGLSRLEKEVLEMDDPSITKIFEYLKTRKDLYEKFDNEEKSINQMYEYLKNKAKPKVKNNVAVVEDNLVYLWAVTYFNKSNKELGIKKEKEKKVMPPSTKEIIEKIDKEQAKKEETKEQDAQISMFEEVQK